MLNAAIREKTPGAPRLRVARGETGREATSRERLDDIIGTSPRMEEIFTLIKKVADSDSTVIINGESGTGKGLIARAIHRNSPRRDRAFVTINCGAIPENLLESELFGHVKGAFTGATSSKQGKFERAHGGSIFLDEIGDMSPNLQVKILRVLEEREFEQVGGTKTIKADVRIIAATHRDLEKLVSEGAFREDLYYRLNVIPVEVPPLRDRKADIPLLTSHFLEEFNLKNGKNVQGVSDNAMSIMKRHRWPGNVRELRNLVERLVVLKGQGEIDTPDLPEKLRAKKGVDSSPGLPPLEISEEGISLNTAVSEFEKALILESLHKTNWVKNQAAKLLHLNRTTLVEKIKRHRLHPSQA